MASHTLANVLPALSLNPSVEGLRWESQRVLTYDLCWVGVASLPSH